MGYVMEAAQKRILNLGVKERCLKKDRLGGHTGVPSTKEEAFPRSGGAMVNQFSKAEFGTLCDWEFTGLETIKPFKLTWLVFREVFISEQHGVKCVRLTGSPSLSIVLCSFHLILSSGC